jgi:hypothetical protein
MIAGHGPVFYLNAWSSETQFPHHLSKERPASIGCASLSLVTNHEGLITRKSNVPATKPSNADIYFQDGGRCAYCGQQIAWVDATVDLIVPRWAGGKSTWKTWSVPANAATIGRVGELHQRPG